MGRGDNPFASLRDAARERRSMEQDEPLWTARRAGRLESAEERALLQRSEHDEFVAHMVSLTAPLDAQATAALDARVAALLSDAQPAEVVRLPARRLRRNLGIAGGMLALAAAVLLMVQVQREPALVLPPYQGTLEGSDRALRGAHDGPSGERARISPGAQVTLDVQPLEPLAHRGPLAARLFLLQGERAEALDVPVQISRHGAVRVSAPYETLFGTRHGAWDLVLFVGESAQLPGAADASERAQHDATDLRVLHFPVELAP